MNKYTVANPMEPFKRQHFAGIEQDMLHAAVDAVREETGLELRAERGGNQWEDGRVRLAKNEPWVAHVKKWAAHTHLATLIQQIHTMPERTLLVADYVNPVMAKRLKEAGIAFIDTVGNAYINQKPIYVYVAGKKPEGLDKKPAINGKEFNQADLKVVYGLLCNEALINTTYRDIAETTNVALGTVGKVLEKLKTAGLLIKQPQKNKWQLANKKKLIDQWAEQYPYKLKIKHAIGIYFADNPEWWKYFDLEVCQGRWGGETAAAKLTNFLKPKTATIYIPKNMLNKLMIDGRLRKAKEWELDQAGRVEVYEAWENHFFTNITHCETTHPLVIYADLMATEDPRNQEAAKVLYDQYLVEYNKQT